MTAELIQLSNREKINWTTTIALVGLHAGAVAAFFMFNWRDFAVAFALNWLFVGFGISLGYHRLHTHRGYRTPLWFEYFLAMCGALTLEGGPIFWVATHRIHHQKSDQPGDPHSPREGAFWAHMGWIVFGESKHNATRLMSRYAPDLAKHRFYLWLNNWHWIPTVVLGVALFAIGGLSMMLWGICVRICFGLHATWAVNSATHMFGYRRFATRDDSRNTWWIALLTFGEGWHNNHHAHPVSARHGLVWWEFDPSWLTLKLFRAIGLVWNIQVAKVDAKFEGREAAA